MFYCLIVAGHTIYYNRRRQENQVYIPAPKLKKQGWECPGSWSKSYILCCFRVFHRGSRCSPGFFFPALVLGRGERLRQALRPKDSSSLCKSLLTLGARLWYTVRADVVLSLPFFPFAMVWGGFLFACWALPLAAGEPSRGRDSPAAIWWARCLSIYPALRWLIPSPGSYLPNIPAKAIPLPLPGNADGDGRKPLCVHVPDDCGG